MTTAVVEDNDLVVVSRGDPKEDHDVTTTTTGKRTVATAPMSPAFEEIYDEKKNGNADADDADFDEQVPASSSTMSSSVSLDDTTDAIRIATDNNDDDDGGDLLNDSIDNPIPNSCSSPYQAFLFSSEWLGSGELQLPDFNKKNKNNNDDAESVASGAYFDPVDLDSSNWRKAISMVDGPTFGFAIVALATALMHPVLFVAGALTAVGTFHAYEYCTGKSVTKSNLSSTQIAASWEQALLSVCYKELPTEEAEKVMEEAKATAKGADEPAYLNSLLLEPNEAVASAAAPAVGNRSTAKQGSNMEEQKTMTTTEPSSQQHQPEAPTPAKEEPLTKEVVEQLYPPLDNTVVKDVSFPGLHAIEFFRVFFGDDAPYNLMELQKQRGDLDIHYGQWKELGPEEPVMLHHDTNQQSPPSTSKSSFKGRVLTFKAKTNNFVGPLYANTRKTQRILLHHKTLVVMEARTDLKEIPFCDRFYVLERWVIRATKVQNGGSQYKYVASLSATSQVVFTNSCSFAGQIKSKSASTIKDLVKCWCIMAKEALKLTEERKTLRLQHEQEGDDSDVESDTGNECEEIDSGLGDDGVAKENLPPSQEEGIEMTWTPAKNDAMANSSTEGRIKPKLKHSGSAPLLAYRGKTLHGIRRSVSSLFNKR